VSGADIRLPQPYLLFLGDVRENAWAKTAFGLRDWAPERCIGEYALPGASVTTGLPQLTPQEAKARGARSMVIGVAPIGGRIGTSWASALLEALESGLDLISGLHDPLSGVPGLSRAAERLGRRLIEVRRPPERIPIAAGVKRTGKRLLTVGTDCALGKKYTALALAKAFLDRGIAADFRATGQTGLLIAGGGMPIDAVVGDFLAGAAESLTPDASPSHWDVIEGQGSLFHPAYAGVSLGLLHGSQPDVIVLCHEPGRATILGYPSFSTPALEDAINLNITLARRLNPRVRCAGISLNTSKLTAEAADDVMERIAEELDLPVADPIRQGPKFDALVTACLLDVSESQR
jgi:uncharacterized NAD-dependent epimerase/dehydratase family protein